MSDAETLLVPVTVALLVVAAGGATAVPAGSTGEPGESLAFDPSVPREYDFSPEFEDGVARVDGERYDTLSAALEAADPGDTVRLRGRFEGPITVATRNLTLLGPGPDGALIEGQGEGDVVTVTARNVTLRGLWVRNSGWSAADNDAGVWLDGHSPAVVNSRVTAVTFGIWVDGVGDARIHDVTVVGRESVTPLSARGNGVQLWRATDAEVSRVRITDVRDGIYYSWAEGVRARNNTMWDLRYGVHYMYSDDCVLANNTAFGNDVGYALMVSEHLVIRDNLAVNNTGRSGHGILLKSVDHTRIVGNHVVGNDHGLFVYNSLDNTVADNLVLGNDVGVYLAAGSVRERVQGNTFLRNGESVVAKIGQQVAWNASERGNYWGRANVVDPDRDGVGEVAHRPAGLVDRLVREHPSVAVFARSPAFDAVRLAQRSLPLVTSPGVVDRHPLSTPRHDWRRYYENTSA